MKLLFLVLLLALLPVASPVSSSGLPYHAPYPCVNLQHVNVSFAHYVGSLNHNLTMYVDHELPNYGHYTDRTIDIYQNETSLSGSSESNVTGSTSPLKSVVIDNATKNSTKLG